VSVHCTDLDPFFDGELSREARAAFLDHLTTCERCQKGLLGRADEEDIAGGIGAQVSRSPESVTRPEKRPRAVLYLAPILAAAAAIAIWLGISGAHQPRAIELSLVIDHVDTTTQRGNAPRAREDTAPAADSTPRTMARAGDVLRTATRGAVHRALLVYRDNQELMIACPGGAACSSSEDELALELRLSGAGEYSIIAIGSAEPVPAPRAPVDVMLSAVVSAGAHFERRVVDVR
jgi:hypothetical protein